MPTYAPAPTTGRRGPPAPPRLRRPSGGQGCGRLEARVPGLGWMGRQGPAVSHPSTIRARLPAGLVPSRVEWPILFRLVRDDSGLGVQHSRNCGDEIGGMEGLRYDGTVEVLADVIPRHEDDRR